MQQINCDCPQCGSNNTVKLSILHQNGKSTGSGYIWYKNDLALNRTTTTTVSSQRAAPPQRIGIVTHIVGGTIHYFWNWKTLGEYLGVCFGIGCLQLIIPGANQLVIGYWIYKGYGCCAYLYKGLPKTDRDKNKYHEDYIQWENTYECQRCSHRFIIKPPNQFLDLS